MEEKKKVNKLEEARAKDPLAGGLTGLMVGANTDLEMPEFDSASLLKTIFGFIFFLGVVCAIITFAFDHSGTSATVFNWFNAVLLLVYPLIAGSIAKIVGDI